ncbi:MAG: helix-turn-helix transcriptional regulator [Chloroflexota bacterium]
MAAPPLVVIEHDNREAAAHLADWRRRAVHAGFRLVDGWSTALRPGTVHTGEVVDDADARLAVRAAIGGAGVIALARGPRDVIDRLVEDLRRLGTTAHVTAGTSPPPRLTADERAILSLLVEGLTLGEVAAALGLPRRTADRRMASARAALGARGTVDAIAKARALGLLGMPYEE